MSKFFDFLIDFAINPKKQIEFAKLPSAVMIAAGLSEGERTAIKSQDSHKVVAAFADKLTPLLVICNDPGQDPLPDPDPDDSDFPPEPDPSENLTQIMRSTWRTS